MRARSVTRCFADGAWMGRMMRDIAILSLSSLPTTRVRGEDATALECSAPQITCPADHEKETARYEIATLAGDGRAEPIVTSAIASEFPISQPFGVEFDSRGRLYICEIGHHRLLRFLPDSSAIEVFAGSGEKGGSGDGGPATAARLDEPYEVRFDASGNTYIVEMVGARVRRVDAQGTITTIAGTGEHGFQGDGGPATRARLDHPHSIALDGEGSLYIADIGNHRIRRVELDTGTISTLIGTGKKAVPEEGEVTATTPILGPRALHITGTTLWIALREGNSVWAFDLVTRRLRHLAGDSEKGFADGIGRDARLNGPKGIVADSTGVLFIVDTENQAIRRLDPRTRTLTTIAGSGPTGHGFGGDGGDARAARFGRPHGITLDAKGAIFIGDTENHRVRVLRPRARE
jgi:sugar lactone lactonase YvrE